MVDYLCCCCQCLCSGVPNVWIVKPWNLGRGMDSLVTNDINAIIRLSAASPRVSDTHHARMAIIWPARPNFSQWQLTYCLCGNWEVWSSGPD